MLGNIGVNYVTRVFNDMDAIAPSLWDGLLARQPAPTPFMRHAYLSAMATSGSAIPETGWTLQLISLWQGDTLAAACPVYLKSHSRGEYVFDWAWAEAYERHGLAYYPKALVAPPFTPVPGTRLLAIDAQARWALVQDYGQKLVYRSPEIKDAKFDGSKATLTFDYAPQGLRTVDTDEVKGFAICGEDKKWVWAKANIIGGSKKGTNQIEVSADGVTKPVAVRYAWADNPVCNLYSIDGLPVTPFRSDDFEMITKPKP